MILCLIKTEFQFYSSYINWNIYNNHRLRSNLEHNPPFILPTFSSVTKNLVINSREENFNKCPVCATEYGH